MSDKATARPWTVNGAGGDFVTLARLTPAGVVISAQSVPERSEEIPNARLIVTAVNAHDALVEAVRTSLANVRSLNAVRPTLGQLGEWEAILVAALEAARVKA